MYAHNARVRKKKQKLTTKIYDNYGSRQVHTTRYRVEVV